MIGGVLLDLIILRSIQIQLDGICHMEAIYNQMEWDDWPESSRKIFQGLRGDSGEEMILKKMSLLKGFCQLQY